MPAHQKVCTIFKFSLRLFSSLLLLAAWASAQTSIDDVHVTSRNAGGNSSVAPLLSPRTEALLIHAEARLVLVPVSVTDTMQRFVTGLQRDNFEVYEGKTPQTIKDFSSEDVPVSIGIILDMSGSMSDKVDRIRDAVNQFCDAANPQDEFFMVVFSDEPRLSPGFTSDQDAIKNELLSAMPKGRTALLDAIRMGLLNMRQARYGKRALLIISDGGDNHSRYSEKEVKAMARESGVMIYSIGIFDKYVPTPEELRGPELLSEIADPTGGRAFTVDTPNALASVARHIGEELRTQYVLAYRPKNVPHDGKWRRIRVKLRLPKHFPFLQARARTGYYASAQPAPAIAEAPGESTTR